MKRESTPRSIRIPPPKSCDKANADEMMLDAIVSHMLVHLVDDKPMREELTRWLIENGYPSLC